MKCKALNQSGINLVKVEQEKKPIVVAVKRSDNMYDFKDTSPSGKKTNIVDKLTKPTCSCRAKNMSGFQCPKIGTRKEGGLKKECGSLWRVTPICFHIQTLT
jgi:hypothetical protein